MPGGLPDEGFFHLGQKIITADKKLHRLAQFIDECTLSVLKTPGQTHHTGVTNVHPAIISRAQCRAMTKARTTPLKSSSKRSATKSADTPSLQSPLTLLGGLSPEAFMKRYWQKKPLLIRQAVPGVKPPIFAPTCLNWPGVTMWSRA